MAVVDGSWVGRQVRGFAVYDPDSTMVAGTCVAVNLESVTIRTESGERDWSSELVELVPDPDPTPGPGAPTVPCRTCFAEVRLASLPAHMGWHGTARGGL